MTLRVGNLGILTQLIKHTYHGNGVLRCFQKNVVLLVGPYGAFPLQRVARFKRAELCRARFWLRFHLA